MAQSTPDSLFRFLLFRPPAARTDSPSTEPATDFSRALVATATAHGPRAQQVKDAATRFTTERAFLKTLEEAPLGSAIAGLVELLEQSEEAATAARFAGWVRDRFGAMPRELVARPEFANAKHRLTESLLAIKFARGTFSHGARLMNGLRVLHGIEVLASSESPTDEQVRRALGEAFRLDALERLLEQREPDSNPPGPGPSKPPLTAAAIRKTIGELQRVTQRRQFEVGTPGRLAVEPPAPKLPAVQEAVKTRLLGLVLGQSAQPMLAMTTMTMTSSSIALAGEESRPSFAPTRQAIDSLSGESKQVLAALQPGFEGAPVWSTVNRLYQRLSGPELRADARPLVSIRFGEASIVPGVGGAFLPMPGYWGAPSRIPTSSGRVQPAGVGDLMVVRQQIKRYEAEEVAHIENILRGTRKERTHRRMDVTEEFFSEEVETTRETEREFSTTERFELQDETTKTLKEDMSLQVGVTISGSYGPTVSFSTSAQFDYNRVQEETARHASSYSKDVVDRSVQRLSERVTKRREQRFRREVEERNLQLFDNVEGTTNISGVYQWITKIYEAQVFNYGKRLMFDFVVPEPAALLRHALFKGKEKLLPEAPLPIGVDAGGIEEDNYAELAARYGATGIEPPPEPYVTVAQAYDQVADGGVDGKRLTKSATLTIPDGYKATDCIVDLGISKGGEWWFDVFVGRNKYQNKHNRTTFDRLHKDMHDETISVPIGIHAGNVNAYTVVIEILCERTETAFQKWRLETFEKIQEAHQARVREYQDALAAFEARTEETAAIGRNPAINRRTEHVELKRACLSVLTEQHFDLFDAMRGPASIVLPTDPNYPQMDFDEALAEGPYVRFFENAFEWEQMTYVFYPYFWGRKHEWIDRLLDQDVDPQFEEFLKAGAARSIVPVRPGFEHAVLHFLETGEIWDGADDPPEIGSPLYVSLVTEIKERTDGVGDGVPVGDPWDVRVPTDLLHLRSDDKLPSWEKLDDGTWQPVETG